MIHQDTLETIAKSRTSSVTEYEPTIKKGKNVGLINGN